MRNTRYMPDISLVRSRYSPTPATRRGTLWEIDLQGNAARAVGPTAQALLRLKKQAKLYHRLACMTAAEKHCDALNA